MLSKTRGTAATAFEHNMRMCSFGCEVSLRIWFSPGCPSQMVTRSIVLIKSWPTVCVICSYSKVRGSSWLIDPLSPGRHSCVVISRWSGRCVYWSLNRVNVLLAFAGYRTTGCSCQTSSSLLDSFLSQKSNPLKSWNHVGANQSAAMMTYFWIGRKKKT